MTHFFYGYFRTCAAVGDEVEMVLPTGAAGNITGQLLMVCPVPIPLPALQHSLLTDTSHTSAVSWCSYCCNREALWLCLELRMTRLTEYCYYCILRAAD